jgi:hypothetical protein
MCCFSVAFSSVVITKNQCDLPLCLKCPLNFRFSPQADHAFQRSGHLKEIPVNCFLGDISSNVLRSCRSPPCFMYLGFPAYFNIFFLSALVQHVPTVTPSYPVYIVQAMPRNRLFAVFFNLPLRCSWSHIKPSSRTGTSFGSQRLFFSTL